MDEMSGITNYYKLLVLEYLFNVTDFIMFGSCVLSFSMWRKMSLWMPSRP